MNLVGTGHDRTGRDEWNREGMSLKLVYLLVIINTNENSAQKNEIYSSAQY